MLSCMYLLPKKYLNIFSSINSNFNLSMIYNQIKDRLHTDNDKFKAVNYLFIFLLLFWSAGFLFPVLSPTFTGKPIINQMLNYNYSIVCHQSESSEITFGSAAFSGLRKVCWNIFRCLTYSNCNVI